MAWLLNEYVCGECGYSWTDEWSCACDDDCPNCGSRHYPPVDSEDLSEVIVASSGQYKLLRSPETAEDDPEYEVVGTFATREEAEQFRSTLRASAG
jgi:hypothetical protein